MAPFYDLKAEVYLQDELNESSPLSCSENNSMRERGVCEKDGSTINVLFVLRKWKLFTISKLLKDCSY